MVSASDEIVPVPHSFKHNEKRTILAFAADLENQEIAMGAGAETCLGTDSVKKIVKGQFRMDDYDFCVAHSNMAIVISPLRGVLRSRFPSKINGILFCAYFNVIYLTLIEK
jgi:ribosomal protein L1